MHRSERITNMLIAAGEDAIAVTPTRALWRGPMWSVLVHATPSAEDAFAAWLPVAVQGDNDAAEAASNTLWDAIRYAQRDEDLTAHELRALHTALAASGWPDRDSVPFLYAD
jgi:hypothetical protein